jgi:hypothetical protein
MCLMYPTWLTIKDSRLVHRFDLWGSWFLVT